MGVETASIAANLDALRERIVRAAQRAGRKPEEITLVAVSKTFPAESIRLAYAAGVRHFGENRVQEWEKKQPLLADLDATWHLVGRLQSNKATRAARLFRSIDSLDSAHLAQKLDHALGGESFSSDRNAASSEKALASEVAGTQHPPAHRGGLGTIAVSPAVRPLVALIEVCLAPEKTKSGVSEADVPALAEAVLRLPHLDLRGLMCLPPYFDDAEQARPYFRKLRELRDAVRRNLRAVGACHSEAPALAGTEESLLPELSMGMSHDFEVAVEEGATQVRLGTAIFGPRLAVR